MNKKFNIWLPVIMTTILIVGIQIGQMLNGSKKPSIFSNSNIGTLEQVLDYVQAKYVDTVNLERLEDGALGKDGGQSIDELLRGAGNAPSGLLHGEVEVPLRE